MWLKILDKVVTPLLFVSVVTTIALVILHKECSRCAVEKTMIVDCDTTPQISQYDDLFKRIGEAYSVDWLLLSAIAHAESEYRFDAVSKAGAVGLMQIMPLVAKSMGYERSQLFEAEISAEIAAKLLVENRKMLHLDSETEELEQLKFILACYNAGYSRIADARRLATYHEENDEVWGIVSTYLSLLSEPEYAEHEVVRSGVFHGSDETIAYVNRVLHIYKLYRSRVIL